MTLTKGNVDYHEVMQWLNTVHLPEVTADIAGVGPPSPTFVPAYYSPQQFGAVADGSSHPLSDYYASLAAAQVDFPFATALTQQIDYCATKKASNMAFGSEYVGPGSFATPDDDSTVSLIKDVSESWTVNEHAGKILSMRYPNGFIHQVGIASNTATQLTLASALPYDFHNPDIPGSVCGFGQLYDCSQYAIGAGEHGDTNAKYNRPLYFPAGTYVFGNDTWLIRNLSGGHIYGAGRRAVRLTSNATVFQTDGLWYSRIEGITFEKLVADTNPCVDIDGNVPGHPYATRSVQANTFYQCQFDGGGSQIAFAMNRQGGSSSQGENSYIECHWINATVCYYQNGFNALANIIIRGDMQDFTTGIYLVAGSINVYGMSFESTHGYAQITDTSFAAQGGFDIDCSASGVGERIIIQGVRSESLRFFRGSSAQVGVLIGCYQLDGGASNWSATTAYSLNQYVRKTVTIGGSAINKMFRVTTAGTSGGTEPTWPTSGTVSDGSVVWTLTEFNVVDASTSGQLYLAANSFQLGNIRQGPTGGGSGGSLSAYPPFTKEITGVSAYTATRDDEFILVDTSAGNVTITLPINNSTPSVPPIGKRYYIKKYSTDANTVTVVGDDTGNMDGDGSATVIPGGSRGWIVVELAAGGNLTQRYWVVAKSFGVGAPTDATYITQTSNGSLSAEQALASLGTGILKNTTGTGVLSIAQDTGWTTGTGTANKGAFATYAGQDVSATYVEAEAQATDDAVKASAQRIKAIEDALRSLGLIN